MEAVGHPTDKIELLILGGTWDAYRKDYQEWFVLRLFDAMNEIDSETLPEAQELNQTTNHRNVGLVIETRPDQVNPKQLAWLRYLGVTKVQMGAQSFDEHILDIQQTRSYRRANKSSGGVASCCCLQDSTPLDAESLRSFS